MDERLRQALLNDYQYTLNRMNPANYASVDEYTYRMQLLQNVIDSLESMAPSDSQEQAVNSDGRIAIPTLMRRDF